MHACVLDIAVIRCPSLRSQKKWCMGNYHIRKIILHLRKIGRLSLMEVEIAKVYLLICCCIWLGSWHVFLL